MQYLDAHPGFGCCRQALEAGEDLAYYEARLKTATGNLQKLLAAFRERGIVVIYIRIASLTQDGRYRSMAHKTLHIHAPPGSRESMILDEIAHQGDEIVFAKTVSSVFAGTNIDYVLRRIEIKTLVATGVLTSGCVNAAVLDAFDRNHNIVLVEDACADLVEEFHETTSGILRVATMTVGTDELIKNPPPLSFWATGAASAAPTASQVSRSQLAGTKRIAGDLLDRGRARLGGAGSDPTRPPTRLLESSTLVLISAFWKVRARSNSATASEWACHRRILSGWWPASKRRPW